MGVIKVERWAGQLWLGMGRMAVGEGVGRGANCGAWLIPQGRPPSPLQQVLQQPLRGILRYPRHRK